MFSLLQVLFDPQEAAAYRAAAACSLDNGELLTVQVTATASSGPEDRQHVCINCIAAVHVLQLRAQ
jgi:hypothetical protein